jgi:hypothetical protein
MAFETIANPSHTRGVLFPILDRKEFDLWLFGFLSFRNSFVASLFLFRLVYLDGDPCLGWRAGELI